MKSTTIVTAIGVMALLGAAWLPVAAQAAQSDAHGTEVAEVMPLAGTRSVMLDFTESQARAIAVGERGHVLVSESRSDWRQIAGVPTRSTLTAVTAVGDLVWAVGHDGVILHSRDGGLSWIMQRRQEWTPPADEDEAFGRDPRFGAPLLAVHFADANTGYAVGAYALMLVTNDGGATWEELNITGPAEAPAEFDESAEVSWTFDEDDLELEAEENPHLNGIAQLPDGTLFIVAERGSAFRSADGRNWERVQLPYDGSMFGVLALGDRHLLAYGLRGNMLESRDAGDSWQSIDTGTELSLMGGAALSNGGAVVVGANGVVLHRPSGASPFSRTTYENSDNETPVLAGVIPFGGLTMIVSGERGIGRFQLNPPETSR
jgi:photosystem II stability/assembly factor-like uncharacterized protein